MTAALEKPHLQDDATIRRDPALRLQMVGLVDNLGEIIGEHATQLAEKRGLEGDPFAFDNACDELLWQLVEYLTQSQVERQTRPPQSHQLTDRHAATWFEVTVANDLFFIEAPGTTGNGKVQYPC